MSETIEFAFRRRYNLPPTDPRFLAATVEDMVIDYWAHRFADDPGLRNEVVAEGYEDDLAEMERESLAREAAQQAEAEARPDTDFEDI